MTARETENNILTRCTAVARGTSAVVQSQQEANVFRVTAMVVQSRFPSEAASLMKASENYFLQHPGDKLPAVDIVRNGWVLSLPRLRDMLSFKLLNQ